MFSDDIVDI